MTSDTSVPISTTDSHTGSTQGAAPPRAPRATARLQLHAGFTFADAARTIDYYAALGISHLYLSPISTARPGSTHGYDVTDHGTINPELGGRDGFEAFAVQARAAGLGLIIDIVPNHMAASANHNPWWRDVLARGPESRYAHHFDIDWHSPDPDLHGKVLLPVLGDPYWDALSAGQIRLAFDDTQGEFVVRYGEQDFPLADDSLPAEADWHERLDPDHPEGRDLLHALLERQNYRLAWWRTAAAELNWRRFFEVSELVGVRVEHPEVFEDVHVLTFGLMRDGWIDGVRVDHVDGLSDPAAYCRELRAQLDAIAHDRPAGMGLARPWIVVEKILAEHEALPADWRTDGTTGYDFMNDVSAVLHDEAGEAPLDALWRSQAQPPFDIPAMTREARAAMLERHLMTEFEAATRALHRCAREDPVTRDVTLASLRRALAALLIPFEVYRTYFTEHCWSQEDIAMLDAAANKARPDLAPDEAAALDVLVHWLGAGPRASQALRVACARVQQLMPPLAAKAVEDTVFYRYGRLLSRNEVGSTPATLAFTPDQFHQRLAARAKHLPHAMLATATHDHKRGEDTRMRLAVLSELAQDWRAAVQDWEHRAAPALAASDTAPDAADRLMLYQTLVGAWPLGPDGDERSAFFDRVRAWQRKSIREGKRHGGWTAPDETYESACDAYLDALEDIGVMADIERFAMRISVPGAVNSLAQTLMQLTAPGAPDRYQGTEGWDFSLVDPDNRRPVDFGRQRTQLDSTAGWPAWLDGWQDGTVKLQLIRATLAARREQPALFERGTYTALNAEGPMHNHVLAFERRHGDLRAISIVTRLSASVVGSVPHVPAEAWAGTTLTLDGVAWQDALTRRKLSVVDGKLDLGDVLAELPCALLLGS